MMADSIDLKVSIPVNDEGLIRINENTFVPADLLKKQLEGNEYSISLILSGEKIVGASIDPVPASDGPIV